MAVDAGYVQTDASNSGFGLQFMCEIRGDASLVADGLVANDTILRVELLPQGNAAYSGSPGMFLLSSGNVSWELPLKSTGAEGGAVIVKLSHQSGAVSGAQCFALRVESAPEARGRFDSVPCPRLTLG